jgi:hypothetical protein
MRAKTPTPVGAREKVLDALSASSLHKLTRDEILMALKEDGIDSLEGLVTLLVKTIKGSEAQRPHIVRPISFDRAVKPTPKERVSAIVHRVPKMPFIFDGVEYDPKDISRFNGRELHFVIGSQAAPRSTMLAFEDRSILTTWLQIAHLSSVSGLNEASIPSSQSSGVVPLVHGPAHPNPVGGSAWVSTTVGQGPPAVEDGPPPAHNPFGGPPEMRIFDRPNFHQNMLTLSKGFEIGILAQVPRGQLLGWTANWDNATWSMASSSSLCAYFEGAEFSGAIRVVAPNVSVFDVTWLGFGSISSVRNMG